MLGKPIIVARGTSMDEAVTDLNIGKVVRYGDVEQLEMALLEIAAINIDERSALIARAKAAYENGYSWGAMRSRLVELYDDL